MMRSWSSIGIVSAAPIARATSSENGPPRDRDHPRPGLAREPRQDRAEEADADDRDGLPRLDLASAEDVHGAAERLAREGLSGERIGQRHDGVGVGDVVLGVGVVGQRRDAVARPEGPRRRRRRRRSRPSPRGRARRARSGSASIRARPRASGSRRRRPQPSRRSRTWPGPGSGRATSSTRTLPGPVTTAARMVLLAAAPLIARFLGR